MGSSLHTSAKDLGSGGFDPLKECHGIAHSHRHSQSPLGRVTNDSVGSPCSWAGLSSGQAVQYTGGQQSSRFQPAKHRQQLIQPPTVLITSFSPQKGLEISPQEWHAGCLAPTQARTHLLQSLLLLRRERRQPQLGCRALPIFHFDRLCSLQ